MIDLRPGADDYVTKISETMYPQRLANGQFDSFIGPISDGFAHTRRYYILKAYIFEFLTTGDHAGELTIETLRYLQYTLANLVEGNWAENSFQV